MMKCMVIISVDLHDQRESLTSTTNHILDVIGVSISLVVNVIIAIIIILLKLYSISFYFGYH